MTDKILLSCGGGGKEMNELISKLIFKIFDDIKTAEDAAILDIFNANKVVVSTDSFVVNPIFFAGGDIGKIAVCGSVNDVCMMGAKALYLSCALIIEEGFEVKNLEKILKSMKESADLANIKIVCGDTKVVPKGACDGIFINTTAVGVLLNEQKPAKISNLKAGAKILLSGDIARHGCALMAKRHKISIDFTSDCALLNEVVLELYNNKINPLSMRDATRGGLSAVLNEWSNACKKTIKIYEEQISISDGVLGICELLGFEALELANEGTFILAVEEEKANLALKILQKFNANAAIIGEILANDNNGVIMQNAYGSTRFVEEPKGELLPRIC